MNYQSLTIATAAAWLLASAAAHADGDAAKGQKVYARCAACHAITDQNKVGPSLLGVMGRKAGAVEGYKYSTAMAGSGVTWDEPTLDAFLKSPKAVIKGTRMTVSVPKDQDRSDLIAYLKTLAN